METRRSVILLLCIVVGVVLAASLLKFLYPTVQGSFSVYRIAASIQTIKSCQAAPDSIACTREPIQELLRSETATEVLQQLSDNLPTTECHRMAHIVGQELYRRFKNTEPALAECTYACNSACVHGVIGEAFVEEVGVDDSVVDPAHVSLEEIQTIGKRLCANSSSCHGVGHILFMSYGHFDPAIAVCGGISFENQKYCVGGVFMEYANELAAKSVWKEFPSQGYPSVASLVSFCDYAASDKQSVCFSFFPHIAVATLKAASLATSTEDGVEQVRNFCESFPDVKSRGFCARGLGEFRSRLIFEDFPAAVQVCQRFSWLQGVRLCVSGMVLQAVQSNKMDTVLSFCRALPMRSVRAGCYTDAFATLSSQPAGSVSDAATLCPSDDVLCIEGAKNYERDSWVTE